MIQLKHVTKRLNGVEILSNLSFHVPQGYTVALLGLSGSGKTTALKLICGLIFPEEGTVSINGQNLQREHLRELRRKMGYVIQEGGLFPHLTAYENLALVGREAGFSAAAIQSRVDELSQMTKISRASLARFPREISGGQRQRIGIMRALFLDPPILLLDEPFGALDPITRTSLQEDLKELFKAMGKTVLMVTHDLHEAGYLAHSILLLNKGKIAQSGSLKDLMDHPANDFVKLFVHSQRQLCAEEKA